VAWHIDTEQFFANCGFTPSMKSKFLAFGNIGNCQARAQMKEAARATAIIGLEPLKNGLMGTLLRYPCEVYRRTNISTTFRT
jgi:hypothetical protein